jgi:hypothetical protein
MNDVWNIHSKFNENSLERRKQRDSYIILERKRKGRGEETEKVRPASAHLYSAIITTLSQTWHSLQRANAPDLVLLRLSDWPSFCFPLQVAQILW